MSRFKRLIGTGFAGLLLVSCGAAAESSNENSESSRVKNAALTTVPAACAEDGDCRVGDIGPGGGTVFYVGTSKINKYGEKYSGGRYMEFVEPDENSPTTFLCSSNIAGTETGVGAGAKNTAVLKEKCPSKLQSRPIIVAWDFVKNKKSDWFLPSNDELNLICRFSRGQTTDSNEKCNAKLAPLPGRNYTAPMWSSSNFGAQLQYVVAFKDGTSSTGNKANDKYKYLLVRAFG